MIYHFDQFELDMARFELRGEGAIQPLEPQVFSLLAYLIEHRERLVPKGELFEKLWDGRVVTDSALTSRIKSARQAIGDSGKAQRFIKTIHGKGFRFVADVRLARSISMVPKNDGTERPDVATERSQRPSVAVLPFRKTADASSCDTLTDGFATELFTEIARLRWLLVIAKGSSFRFREPDLDLREVGRVLGIRY
jgi:DNA-binding winged helix-turn-helix (wHTH) protein